MIANIVINISGILIFLFIFWKKLKEDYVSGIIFSSAFIVLFGILAGYVISLRFFRPWMFWGEFVGLLIALAISISKYKLRVYEVFEASVVSLLPWYGLVFLNDSVINSSLSSFIGFGAILVLLFLYYFVDLKYKDFTWYRSGKIGFSGLAVAAIFFLIRAVVAIFTNDVLSFHGRSEVYIAGSFFLLGVVLIILLSREKV